MLRIHGVAVTIIEFSSEKMLALISQLVDFQTEENSLSHLKSLLSIQGQINLKKFTLPLEKYPLDLLITNLHPTINLSIKLSLYLVNNLKPNSKTHLNINTTQSRISSYTYSGILRSHLQQLVIKILPILFLGQTALKYCRPHIYFKWRGCLFLQYQTCN